MLLNLLAISLWLVESIVEGS